MNVLLTSTARRIDFVRFFQEAYEKLNIEGKVIVADPDYNAPSLQQGDVSYIIPHQSDDRYIEEILEICKKNDVKGLIPLNDWEVPKLADNKSQFDELGVTLFVPTPDVVDKVRDKGKYREVLGAFEVKAPRSYIDLNKAIEALEKNEVSFPLILKPRNGSASIGVEIAHTIDEMKLGYKHAISEIENTPLNDVTYKKPEDNVIIQEVIEGDKFSVDIFNDAEGNFVASFVRKQLAMRGGDVDRSITVDEERLQDIASKMGNNLGHAGYINTDVYYDGSNYYVIDINPRFGGGYAFSHHAGADIPAVMLALLAKKEVKEEWLHQEADLEFARYDLVKRIDRSKGKKLSAD